MEITLNINDVNQTVQVEPGDMLLEVLRKLGYKSVKKGCDTGACGICTILINHLAVPSCSYLALRAQGKKIYTIEGVEKKARTIGEYIIAEGADQCGFCTPGLIMTIIAMEHALEKDELTEENIKKYLVGNACRCTGYQGHLRAIKKYLGVS